MAREPAAAAVQPPARADARLLVRHRVQDGPGAERARAEGAGGRVRGGLARARPRRPQLQPAHAGRVARDDQGARDRPLRHGPVDDRQRLLGRLARPAAGGERLSGRLPGHHAAVLVPGRVVVRDPVRGVLLRPEVPPGPVPVGTRSHLRPGGPDGVLRPPEHREPAELHDGDPELGRAHTVVPGGAERQGLRRAHEPARRALHAPGLHGQRVRPRRARLRPARLRQRRGAVRPEGAPRRPRLARPVRGLQRQHRRGRHGPQHRAGADRGRSDRARAAVPDRRDRLREQPRQGRDHRPARPRSRRLPRRLPHLRDAGPARAELRHGREPDPVARNQRR